MYRLNYFTYDNIQVGSYVTYLFKTQIVSKLLTDGFLPTKNEEGQTPHDEYQHMETKDIIKITKVILDSADK